MELDSGPRASLASRNDRKGGRQSGRHQAGLFDRFLGRADHAIAAGGLGLVEPLVGDLEQPS